MEKKSKRDLILEAADEIFKEKGYHTTTLDEVAKRAGVGKGTIYQYFSSKQEVFNAIQLGTLEAYSNMILENVDMDQSFEENIIHLHDVHLKYAEWALRYFRDVLLATHQVDCSAEDKSRMEATALKLQDTFTQFLQKSIERGELRSDISVEAGLATLLGAFVSLNFRLMEGTKVKRTPEEAQAYIQQVKAESVHMILFGMANNG